VDILSFVNFYLLPGIVQGSIYALGAIGITLVFSIMRYARFAHGDLATLGAFLALLATRSLAISPYIALPIAVICTGFLAIGIDKVFYAYLRNRPKIITTIASFGVALMLRSVVQVFWGVDTTSYARGITRPQDWFGIRIKSYEITTLVVAIGLVIALHLFLTRHKWGKAMRAMSNNPDLAQLSGVDNAKVVALTWAIVGALCAASGFFLGLNTELKSSMGWNILLPTFAAAILGGVGRIEGAIIGGLIVGIVQELSVLVIPTDYKLLSAFAILVVMLLVRPTGIFRGKVLT
jgi:branched-chain amino acid transport system permease protein/neutral amino acid transport system permease protein